MSVFVDFAKKVKEEIQDLPANVGRAQQTLDALWNPNHRHDDEDEKRADQLRTDIANSHRFQSFGKERDGNNVKWYIDGHDYFWALSEMLEEAKECICILDWWLTPELYLRRPPQKHEQYRLDKILHRKASQGVKIYIVVYKEVTQTMTMSSAHTKHYLEALHPNIAVMRHPDHLGGEVTFFWSHHEKVVIVDNVMACIGGLDICFGRWDTHTFPGADVHPFDVTQEVFPGQDYNNARVQDFQSVDHWVSNQQSRLETARMPWHDLHTTLVGPVVLDIAQHFVERWNFVKGLKYRKDNRFPMLAFPHVYQEPTDEPIARHPHLEGFRKLGMSHIFHSREPNEGGHRYGGSGKKGNMRVQVCRSSADWSSGILTEHSIQNAYIQLIREANHFIYIENQFFISNSETDNGPVKNVVAMAIVERILAAARDGKKFKVFILIPAVPGFAGDLQQSGGTLAIMDYTYKSICRGGHSIMEKIAKEGYDPNEYIQFYNLRMYDRINSNPRVYEQMEQETGLKFGQVQAAVARVYLGPDATKGELEGNATLTFKKAQEGENKSKDMRGTEGGEETQELPQNYNEAKNIVDRWNAAAPSREERIKSSINFHALQSGGSIWDEPWDGDEESEKQAFVTEELYIHSKLLIVDDRRVLIGSANLNDRSQNGDHDSEIAIIIEDNDTVETTMDGAKYLAARFATSFRRQIFKEHLGLIPPQWPGEKAHDAMHPVGTRQEYEWDSEEDRAVADPLSDDFLDLWRNTARKNTEAFGRVFHCVPAKEVESWDDYKTYVPGPPQKVGHVAAPNLELDYIKENLASIRGHLVEMPLNFLQKENLFEFGAAVNEATLPIYL